MSFAVDLTMSGLCVLVFQPGVTDPKGYAPKNAELLCVDAPGHYPRLVIAARDLDPTGVNVQLGWFHDSGGNEFATVDLTHRIVSFKSVVGRGFSADWNLDSDQKAPRNERETDWMRWVTDLASLGVEKLRLPGSSSELPQGWNARLLLPEGRLKACKVIKGVSSPYAVWSFHDGKERAIADDVMLRVEGVEAALSVTLTSTKGDRQIVLSLRPAEAGTPLRVGISNDVTQLDSGKLGQEPMGHLHHIGHVVTEGKVCPPKLTVEADRTSHPICNVVRFHWTRNADSGK